MKNPPQLDLVLQSEDGGDLSGFMPNGRHSLAQTNFLNFVSSVEWVTYKS